MILEKVQYTARIHTTGGRDGAAHSDDGRLAVKLSTPGASGTGTNPEQLFAAGWSTCFIGAMRLAAAIKKITLPADPAIDAEVDLGTTGGDYFLRARLNVSLPGLKHEIAQSLVDAATSDLSSNIDVAINLLQARPVADRAHSS
jgi:lipoyl-dependent peroxiredoxin